MERLNHEIHKTIDELYKFMDSGYFFKYSLLSVKLTEMYLKFLGKNSGYSKILFNNIWWPVRLKIYRGDRKNFGKSW